MRILTTLSVGALFAVSAAAQCIDISSPGTFLLATDETISAQQALGFTYPNPLGGALPGGYTHCLVSPNGWIVLTDGVGTGANPGTFNYGSTGNTNTGLGGGAGSFPLIAPYWGDGDTTGALAGEGVFFKASTGPGIPAEITYIGHRDWNTTPKRDCRVLIFDTGVIQFQYSAVFAVSAFSARYVAVSTRNGIATVPPQTPLGAAPASSGTSGMCFKTFPTGPVNLADHELTIVQNGTGGWDVVNTCGTPILPPPSQLSVGTGCYNYAGVANGSFYELFPNAAAASAALQGNSLSMTPIASPPGYVALWNVGGATSYFPPASATGTVTSLAVSDDGLSTITPSVPMNTPFGAFPDLTIGHNGHVSLGATGPHLFDWTPSGVDLATATQGTFYSWSDYRDDNTTPVASGLIKYFEETVSGNQVLYITWDGVDHWASPQVSTPSTLQFQLNLTTGDASIVWVTIDTNTTSTFGSSHLVGFSPPGTSVDPGSVVIATASPIITSPDDPAIVPMAMSINVLPGLVSPSGDTVPMTWTVTNVPSAVHLGFGPDLRACNLVFSIAPAFVAGYDLGTFPTNIGAQGCNGYLAAADAFIDITTLNTTGICTSAPLTFPGTPSLIGVKITSQAIALAPPGLYAGGAFTNDIGGHALFTSNAVEQTYYPL